MANEKLKVGVLGLGLIGGSILKALHSTGKYFLYAVSKSSYKKAESFADVASCDINLLAECDVVFVCSKMNETNEKLYELNSILKKETIVADVCSIKNFLPNNLNYNFISSHPMAGTEFTGFENSFKELFYNAKWIIEKNNPILEELILDMKAKPILLERKKQDEITAKISHLPMLIAFALFDSTENEDRIIASSGFRDMTRLALTNPDMAFDMLHFNKENILAAYKKLLLKFEELKNSDEENFKNKVRQIAEKRQKMYDKNGKNILWYIENLEHIKGYLNKKGYFQFPF